MATRASIGSKEAYSMQELLAEARRMQPKLTKVLAELVRTESPSEDKSGVNACVALVEKRCAELGGVTRRHRSLKSGGRDFGDVLEVRFGPAQSDLGSKTSKLKPVLLLGHLDTVWPLGTLQKMPFHVKDGRAFGPGVFDMKGGVAVAMGAVEILLRRQLLTRPVILLLNSDEEVGSPVSRRITEKLAVKCEAVLVLEPAQGIEGAYKTARKGVGEFRLHVKGVAAHSGIDFERGHSAIVEVARLVGEVVTFTDLSRGLTVNPGVIRGGTRSNVVAAEAWVDVDVRIAKAADAARIEKRFRSLRPNDRGCTLTVTGGINRPPMERTAKTIKLFRFAETLAGQMSLTLQAAATGGGSDGNFTSALGVPTLDGMGAVGEGAHAPHECLVLDQLASRTALLAAIIAGLEGLA